MYHSCIPDMRLLHCALYVTVTLLQHETLKVHAHIANIAAVLLKLYT